MKQFLTGISGITVLFFMFTIQVGVTSCTKEEYIHDTTTMTVHDTTTLTVHDTLTLGKECPPPTYPITGVWIGTYTADLLPNDSPQYYSFIIKPDGKLTVESHPNGNIIYASGTWTLTNNVLKCDFIYPDALQGYPVTQKTSAVYDKIAGKLTSGVWENIGAPDGSGKFTMERVSK